MKENFIWGKKNIREKENSIIRNFSMQSKGL